MRGRSIIVAEAPHLHLVWARNLIYLKPIPRYLLSHAFWRYLAAGATPQHDAIRRAAAGFLRTYSHLVRHESDFRVARRDDLALIPADDGTHEITWDRFAAFIGAFARVDDADVCPRYSYGELRLTRLNFYTRLLQGKLTFHHVDTQWASMLGSLLAPLLSVFAILSVVLSAMQVELAVPDTAGNARWAAFSSVSRWFCVVTLVVAAAVIACLGLFVVFMFVLPHTRARTLAMPPC